MIRIDYLLFGYEKIYISDENMPKALTALLSANLSTSVRNGEFLVFAPSLKKYKKALGNIPYTSSGLLGLPGQIYKRRHRYGIFAALLVLLFYFAFSSMFVWDVRISGNDKVSSSAIEAELATVGIRSGVSWRSLSLNEAERALLEKSDTIGWLNVNRRGGVAYVTVKEKNVRDKSENPGGYSNVVATVDCVIEEITVKSGVAAVKPGDTVRAGQILISGVIPPELGGGFTRAEGEILGRVFEKISVDVLREETVTVYENEEPAETRLKFFDFSVNIFKNYRNSPDSCVIIEDTEELMLFGKWRLPVEVTRIYSKRTAERLTVRDDAELIAVAASRLESARVLRLADAEVLKMKTEGEFTEAGYRMTSSVTVLCNIGEERMFAP